MKRTRLAIFLVAALLMFFVYASVTGNAIKLSGKVSSGVKMTGQTSTAVIEDKTDLTADGYTVFGKWMINTSKKPNYPADWLQQKYPDPADGNKNKTLVEPINIVIVDTQSKSADAAIKNFDKETIAAGYLRWPLHSAGYKAYLKDNFYWQIFNGNEIEATCYQTKFPLETNNHGRVFGPVKVGNAWIFSAAFSREKLSIIPITHKYVSFLRAAKDFAKQMNSETSYKIAGALSLNNNIVKNASQFTGDHDGNAIVLRR